MYLCLIIKALTIHRDENTVHPFCRDNPESCIGGSLNADYLSTKGVFSKLILRDMYETNADLRLTALQTVQVSL
jgi:hypothetical protein